MELEVETIAIIIILIIIPILIYLIRKWYLNYQEKKGAGELGGSSVGTSHALPSVVPGKSRTVATSSQLKDWTNVIEDSIHTFSGNDLATIISTFNNIKTKKDLSVLLKFLEIDGYHILDTINKDMTSSQRDTFSKWMKNLPEYVDYVKDRG